MPDAVAAAGCRAAVRAAGRAGRVRRRRDGRAAPAREPAVRPARGGERPGAGAASWPRGRRPLRRTTRSARPTAPTPRPRASRTCCPRLPVCCWRRSWRRSSGCWTAPSTPSSSSSAASRWPTRSASSTGFTELADAILIGGAMAFTFLAAQGVSVGASRHEDADGPGDRPAGDGRCRGSAAASWCCRWTSSSPTGSTPTRRPAPWRADAIPDGWMGLDIGPQTVAALRAAAGRGARTIFWNGPMGVFELAPFARGHARRRRRGRRRPRRCRSSAAATRSRRQRGRRRRPDHARLHRRRRRARAARGQARCPASPRWRRQRGMSRRPFVAGNWKMHKTASEAGPFVRGCRRRAARGRRTSRCARRSRRLRRRSRRRPADARRRLRAEHAPGRVGRVHRRDLGGDAARRGRRRRAGRPLRAAPALRRDRRGREREGGGRACRRPAR